MKVRLRKKTGEWAMRTEGDFLDIEGDFEVVQESPAASTPEMPAVEKRGRPVDVPVAAKRKKVARQGSKKAPVLGRVRGLSKIEKCYLLATLYYSVYHPELRSKASTLEAIRSQARTLDPTITIINPKTGKPYNTEAVIKRIHNWLRAETRPDGPDGRLMPDARRGHYKPLALTEQGDRWARRKLAQDPHYVLGLTRRPAEPRPQP